MKHYALIDETAVDTPAGLAPVVAQSAISGVPSAGTGLSGAAYVSNSGIWSMERFEQVVASSDPVLNFTASELDYSGRSSATTISQFLGDDAASITGGDGDAYQMGPSGLVLTGYVYIPEGIHEISIGSDDGFSLAIGGVPFSEFNGSRGHDETARVAEFDGGLYQVDMAYFDGGGWQSLNFQIDGLTVDQSAFYADPADFTNPPADVPLVPVEDYHPSLFIEDALDIETTDSATQGVDEIQGMGADETLDGEGGDDIIHGGYGDDYLIGGDGDDLLDGGRGSDILFGGAGDDLLIARSDGGEQRIGQLALGTPTRPDAPGGEVNQDRQKLAGYEDQPLISDDILFGGEGRDTFLISPLINGKLDIIEKHTRSDGTINWGGVAGENTYLHDHWVDLTGIDIIGDFVAGEDTIAVIGHTANVYVEYRDTDNDGDEESIITIVSNQHGGGGAHDDDLIGFAIVHGDRIEQGDIVTDAGVTYGIVESYSEVAEALFPAGDVKVTTIEGETVYGYDTRDANGNLGPVTGSPEDFVDNPWLASVTFAAPSEVAPNLTRYPFEQLGTTIVTGESDAGTSGNDAIRPAEAVLPGLPGALLFYDFTDGDGSYDDARNGPDAKAYTLYESQSVLRTDGITTGPDGLPNALEFNGRDQFAHIQHDSATNVTQGTIAAWVRPDNLDKFSTFISKDQSGTGDGGHFRLSHTGDGQLFLRMAPGDGGGNKAWKTITPQFTEGDWSHVAVSFTDEGVIVYVDGQAVPDLLWTRVEGNVETPGIYTEAYMVANDEAWVLGADSFVSRGSATAAEFAVNDDRLQKAFDGAIAEFGMWGGFTAEDALTHGEINDLMVNGPGAALTNPSGPQAMIAGDDSFSGGDGDDLILGEAGDDTLDGGDGADSIDGGYGDDSINGGAGNDVLDGGRGNDLLIGGLGDDILLSRSDAGEQRIGQLVLGDPSRPDDGSVDYEFLKLVDWIDQPLRADDVLIGGEGSDLFYFEPLINAKMDIILEHVREDRTINWAGVAGENRYLHDHWVDHLGIDIVADYVAGEDTIAVIGHTSRILEITYQSIDTDDDGQNDSVASYIQIYSQQGSNGGAHDEDLLGMIVVIGDLVLEEDIITNPGVTPGIVTTIDELQEAMAPTGETKISFTPEGEEIFGYDSRDITGDPLATNPLAYSDNPFLANGDVTFQNQLETLGTPVILLESEGGSFNGTDDFVEIAHDPLVEMNEGSWSFTFSADSPGDGTQMLLSKDHSGYKDGGHLTIWITHDNRLEVRFQGTDRSINLKTDRDAIETGEAHHVVFTFTEDTLSLYLDGELISTRDGVDGGMSGNAEDLVLGASTVSRWEDNDNLRDFFDGTIGDLAVFDRALEPVEVLLLSEAMGDAEAIGNPPPEADILGDASDNRLYGTDADDIMDAGAGNDIVNGRAGADIMMGGAGDDRYYCDDANDQVIEYASGGYDRMYTSISTKLADNVEAMHATGTEELSLAGNDLANWIDGNAADNTITGGDGNDRLRGKDGDDLIDGEGGNDMLEGGAGADTFRIGPNGGLDRVLDFELGIDMLDFVGVNFADIQVVDGSAGAILYYDADNRGNNLVVAGITAAQISASNFSGASNPLQGTAGNDRLFGTDGNDVLEGLAGNDAIYGRAGADTMVGGTGDDRFYVDDANDQTAERAGEGYDRTYTTVSATLGENIEAMHATGSDDITLTGNGLANWMDGNTGDNTLLGGDGNDRLRGRDGDDVLDGQGGNDILEGGAGADIFRIGRDGGVDQILDFQLGADRIDLTGTGASPSALSISDSAQGARIHYDGSDYGNVVIVKGVYARDLGTSDFIHDADIASLVVEGSSGNDVFDGRGEATVLIGGAGDDRFYVDGPDDEIIEGFGEGYDRVYAAGDYTLGDNIEAISANGTGGRALTGNELANWVTGGAGNDALMGAGGNDRVQGRDGNDLIQGGTGNDILAGGAGIDIFRFGRGDGSDVIQDFELGTDLIAISGGMSMSRLHIYDSANGAVVRYDAMNGGDVSLVVLNGVNASQLDANDFSF